MSNKKARGPDIGLHQAKRLCQLPQNKRLDFIAEGLSVIFDSAQGFWEGIVNLTATREDNATGLFRRSCSGDFRPQVHRR